MVCFLRLSIFLTLRSTLVSCYFHMKFVTFLSSLLSFSCFVLLDSQHYCVGKFHLFFLGYFHVLLCILYFKRTFIFFLFQNLERSGVGKFFASKF